MGSEAVRCSLRLENLPYTADEKQHVYIKEFLLTVTLWTANGESKEGGKDRHVVVSPIFASCACQLRLGDALST